MSGTGQPEKLTPQEEFARSQVRELPTVNPRPELRQKVREGIRLGPDPAAQIPDRAGPLVCR